MNKRRDIRSKRRRQSGKQVQKGVSTETRVGLNSVSHILRRRGEGKEMTIIEADKPISQQREGGRTCAPNHPLIDIEAHFNQTIFKHLPPAVCTLNDNIQVLRVDVHCVLYPILPYNIPCILLQLRRYGVLRGVHVRDLGPSEAPRESLPGACPDVVCLANIEAPDAARGGLQNMEEAHDLRVPHTLIEVLQPQRIKKEQRGGGS